MLIIAALNHMNPRCAQLQKRNRFPKLIAIRNQIEGSIKKNYVKTKDKKREWFIRHAIKKSSIISLLQIFSNTVADRTAKTRPPFTVLPP